MNGFCKLIDPWVFRHSILLFSIPEYAAWRAGMDRQEAREAEFFRTFSECDSHTPANESNRFFEVFKDCRGNTELDRLKVHRWNTSTVLVWWSTFERRWTFDPAINGRWFKLNMTETGIEFRGKHNTAYHFSPRPMTKTQATQYSGFRISTYPGKRGLLDGTDNF